MTRTQVTAALNCAFWFLDTLSPSQLPPGPLTARQEKTVRDSLLRLNFEMADSHGHSPFDVAATRAKTAKRLGAP